MTGGRRAERSTSGANRGSSDGARPLGSEAHAAGACAEAGGRDTARRRAPRRSWVGFLRGPIASVALLWAWLVHLACAPPAPALAPPPAVSVLDSGRALGLSSERLVAEVDLGGVVLARLDSRTCLSAEARRMQTAVESAPLVSLLRKVGGEAVTTFEGQSIVPRRSEYFFREGDLLRHYQVRHGAGRYRHRYDNGGEAFRTGQEAVPGGGIAHDLHSALAALRSWRPRLGEQASLHAVLGRHLWEVQLWYRGPEMITFGGQPRLSYRIEAEAHRLPRPGVEASARSFVIWLDDGPGRVPLRIAAQSRLGRVRVELVRRTTGTAQCGAALPPATHGAPRGTVRGN